MHTHLKAAKEVEAMRLYDTQPFVQRKRQYTNRSRVVKDSVSELLESTGKGGEGKKKTTTYEAHRKNIQETCPKQKTNNRRKTENKEKCN